MLFGIDYAYGKVDPKVLKANGVHFVCRYLSTPGNSKNITKAEADALKKAGVDIVLVFETTANRALSGYVAGVSDATSARQQAAAAGLPNAPVYFAVDFDVAPAQEPQVKAYFKGVAFVLGKKKAGVYGGYRAVSTVQGGGIVKFGWQTYAWSYGKWHPGAQLRQVKNGQVVCGVKCDHDNAVAKNFGQSPGRVEKKARAFARYFIKFPGGVVKRVTWRFYSAWVKKHR